ncbi:MAG: MarR family transcriptional regulator [Deltaproteobacteria bacterium RBG_13_43_22]|nr:MAG: MarR family transcriptional regulator [Deltaproteobacteria bacterium RBG_13_43_22]
MPENLLINTDCYIFLLAKAYQKAHGLVQTRLKPYKLTNIQYLVLEVLWQKEKIKAAELGELLSIDKATLSGILDRMDEGGWIKKQRDKGDKRIVRLLPSKKANDLRKRLVKEREKANEILLSRFTLEERILLRRLLLEIV